jgi:flagellar motility protein MotE (MotC chaperone)
MGKTKTVPHKKRARVLPVLAILFAFGAALRVVSGLNAAYAQDPEHQSESVPAHASASDLHAETAATQHASAPAPALSDHEVANAAQILVDLRRREVALQEREAAVSERETLIAAGQERLHTQIAALQSAEQELTATLALADRAAEEDIGRLVSVFSAMGSEEAAAVFSEMAPDFAAGFLARLAPETAAAILSGLEPRQAYGLSAILAGRNALVPRN